MKGIFGEAYRARRYRREMGACQDCGWERPLTLVHFWTSNMPYYVCSECIRPYRQVIMHPDPEWRRNRTVTT